MTWLVDLASARLGGLVLGASDEFFAPKERLLAPEPPAFDPQRYTDRGKEMDGWETRRRRGPGFDWAVVRLGVPGIVREVVVDTRHFRGNHPAACEVDACDESGGPCAALVPRSPLDADSEHRFEVEGGIRATHVRLAIHPDGGVARLRVHGEPLPDLRGHGGMIDLAAVTSGGIVTGASDARFAPPSNLLLPGEPRTTGDGWETRRRRGPGHDWVTVRLATEGVIERIEVDTTHFVGNHPSSCALSVAGDDLEWAEVLRPTPLAPHARHVFPLDAAPAATHARLEIHPDGGIARLRLPGTVTDAGWRRFGIRLLDALPAAQADAELLACCASRRWAREVAARRPFGTFERLREVADTVWDRCLQPSDWEEALAAHPRIGDRASGWSGEEQRGTAAASASTREALAEGNRAYEARFHRTFVIRASGRSADEMLDELRNRLGNDEETELRVAAGEQRQIMLLRLERMMRPGRGGRGPSPGGRGSTGEGGRGPSPGGRGSM